MERLSQAFEEGERGDEHHESPATRLANMLKRQVLPVIRQTLVKSARGGTDKVPGYAQERQRTETTRARQSMKNDIEDQIRTMPAFSHHQNAQNSNFRNPSNETELNLYGSEKEMIQRRIFLWTEANKQAQGAYRDEITKWRMELHKNSVVTDHVMSAVYGVGAAQARKESNLRAVLQPLPQDRPWTRQRAPATFQAPRGRYCQVGKALHDGRFEQTLPLSVPQWVG